MENQAQNHYENTWQCPFKAEHGCLQVGHLWTWEMVNDQRQIMEIGPGKGAI